MTVSTDGIFHNHTIKVLKTVYLELLDKRQEIMLKLQTTQIYYKTIKFTKRVTPLASIEFFFRLPLKQHPKNRRLLMTNHLQMKYRVL